MSRPLPALNWPLAGSRWQALLCESGQWRLLPAGGEPLLLRRVDIVLDLGPRLWLRLRWGEAWPRRLWPSQTFIGLTRAQQPGLWALLRAHLALQRRRHWLGAA